MRERRVYKWKPGFPNSGVNPSAAHAELKRLEAAKGGLTLEAIVTRARGKKSPLHSLFEWDDTKAAEAHRRRQARLLKKNLQVVVVHADGRQEPPEPAFVTVRVQSTSSATSSSSRRVVASGKAIASDVLMEAIVDLRQWQRKFKPLELRFPELWRAVDDATDEIDKLIPVQGSR